MPGTWQDAGIPALIKQKSLKEGILDSDFGSATFHPCNCEPLRFPEAQTFYL